MRETYVNLASVDWLLRSPLTGRGAVRSEQLRGLHDKIQVLRQDEGAGRDRDSDWLLRPRTGALEPYGDLDAGCGTGNYSKAMLGYVGRIEAVDLNPGMLEVASRKAVVAKR